LIDINPNSKFINSMGQENFTDSQKVPAQLLARAEQSNPVNPALHQAQEQNLPVEPRIQAPKSCLKVLIPGYNLFIPKTKLKSISLTKLCSMMLLG
jgi:hypothetical protein